MKPTHIILDYEAWRSAHSPMNTRTFSLSRTIIRQTAADHGVTVAELVGPQRCRRIARARQDAMSRLRAVEFRGAPRYSLPYIGMILGNRHHTTVMHGIKAWRMINERKLSTGRQSLVDTHPQQFQSAHISIN